MTEPNLTVRPTEAGDIPALQPVLDETELFPRDMLPDLMTGYLAGDGPDAWLTCMKHDRPVGFCFAEPEALADGTWNMRAIAVLPKVQGQGAGRALVAALEARLAEGGGRVLIADTSGIDAFADTRAFYDRAGYTAEARIRDFWGPGDDKVVYWKALT